jgi:CRP/FNR family transcriptional regulator, transcriptional activator FtrB
MPRAKVARSRRLVMKPDLEALRSLPLLRSFPDNLLAALNETADLVRFAPAEEVFKAGERLSQLHYLLSGSVGATRLNLGEEDDLVDVLLPVQPLCLPAVLLDLPAPIGAYTLTAGHLITLSASRLREVIAGDAGLARPFLDYALRQAHEQTLENSNLKLRSSAQRLAGFMLGLIEDPEEKPARFVLPFKKELVAVRIGCTQEHLSRAFATLREIGVQTWQGAVLVHDVPALRAFSYTSGRSTDQSAAWIVKRYAALGREADPGPPMIDLAGSEP